MSLQGGTQIIAAGAVQAIVTGVFPATYQVGISTGWVSGWRVTGKTTTQFTVDFTTPAPAGGSTFDWVAGTAISPSSSSAQAITAGATSITITGTFATAYEVAIGPAWLTDVSVTAKTATSFLLTFGTPCPAGGSTLDWIALVIASAQAAAGTNVSPIGGASQFVTGGTTMIDIVTVGSLPAAYEITVGPGWVTSYDVVNKSGTGFTLIFAVPAPPSGARVDWVVLGASGAVSLSDYLDELRDLLHDPDDRAWSANQKANYINRARRRRDIDTAVNRSTISFTLTTGVGSYTLAQVGAQIIDVFSIVLILGTWRTVLNNLSLTEMNMGPRTSTNFSGWTTAWARQGEQNIIFGPSPSQPFVTEWDCVVYLPPLINLTDTDAVSYPYTQPVPYYAAYLAKTNEREGGQEGDWFLDKYMELCGFATNQRVGRIPNSYSGLGMPGGWRGY